MQRRAAAAYVALFLVVGAGAYAVIGVADKPHVEMDGPAYSANESLTVDDRTYTLTKVEVSGGGGGGGHGGGGGETITGTLSWTDQNATETVAIENNATVSWQTVSWEDQATESTVLEEGQEVGYSGNRSTVVLNASAGTVTFQHVDDESINATFEQGEQVSVTVDGQFLPGRTITEVTDSEATIAIGDEYRLDIPNESDPSTAEFLQQFNVTRRLVEDPMVYNETNTIEGVEYVTNRTTNQNTPLEEYLPDPEVHEIAEGDTITYEGNESTVGNITADEVPMTQTLTQTKTVTIEEGDTVELGPNNAEYIVHFPDNSSAQILENTTSNYNAYQSELAVIDSYNERMSGLWGVVYLSFMAALILGAAAYLPVKD